MQDEKLEEEMEMEMEILHWNRNVNIQKKLTFQEGAWEI